MGNPTVRHVPFNALPSAVRQRLVAATQYRASPAPLLANVPADIGPVVGIVLVALCAAGWLYVLVDAGFGAVGSADGYQPAGTVAWYASSLFLLGWCVLSLVRRAVWRDTLPYKAGTYLFPIDLVDASGPVLKVFPLALLRELQPTRHYVNGGYTHTSFALTFDGGARYHFSVSNMGAADEALARFRAAQGRFREAAQVGDLNTIRELDLFFDCHMDGSWDRFGPTPPGPVPPPPDAPVAVVRVAPRPLQRAWLTALAAAALTAGPLWFARNRLSDLLRYDEVSSPRASAALCQAYLSFGGPHADEVRAQLLPRAALREAEQRDNVTALRAWLREYPRSPLAADARRAVHGHFERVQRTYTEQAATDDPRMLPFMLHMLRFMEERDSPPVQVRFAPPSTELLTRADSLLQEEGMRLVHRPVAPIAGQFDEASSVPREQAITRSLQRAFAVVFPGDILRLVDGGRMAGAAAAQDPNAATFDVAYTVAPSGSFYTSDTQARAFVGIIIAFTVTMRVPGAEPYRFDVTVQPPRHFTVDHARGTEGEAADTLVYDVMAERAFDRLSDRFRAVFFRPGSPGFNGGARDDANDEPAEPAEPQGATPPQGANGDGEPAGDAPTRGSRRRRR